MYREKVKKALENKIKKCLEYNLEGEPVLKLKNGKQFIIYTVCGRWYAHRDFGATYREIIVEGTFDEVVDLVIKEGAESK